MSNWVSQKCYKILNDLTEENRSGFYRFNEKKIESLLSYLQKYFGEKKSYDLYRSDNSLNHKFTVDINEDGVLVAKLY